MKKSLKIILIVLISIFIIVGTMFVIDHYRMNKDLPVLFSTWGKKYAPLLEYKSTGTAEYLFDLKTPYIGNNSAVSRLLDKLDIRLYGQYTIKLETKNKPYILVINYNVIEGLGSILNNPKTIIEKSAILLALIGNADEIHWILPDSEEIYKITIDDLLTDYGNIKDYGKSVNDFKQLLIKLTYYEENEPITMSIDTLTNTGLTFTITNHTNNRYNYGEPYYLERKENDKWDIVKQIKDNCAFNLIGYTLVEKQEYKEEINWKYCYGKLPKGKYRIIKDFTHIISETESRFKFGKKHFISAEFLIK